MGCVAAFILCYSFKYPFQLGLYHIISLSVLLLSGAALIVLCKYLIRKHNLSFFLSNGIAAGLWVFLCLFYPIVLGSNHFWGNTITFEILKNYLTSLDALLSILPIDKGLMVSALVLYLLISLGAFYFIRIKKEYFATRNRNFGSLSKRKVVMTVLLFCGFIWLIKKPILSLKRTIHFSQEPLVYFALGPMWETHSDELLGGPNIQSEKDRECIEAIHKTSEKDKLAIIILLDALRSDHLPMYGYPRNTAPFLDSLYRSGKLIKIKNSFSNSTNTIGGISALFYSKDWDHFSYSDMNLMQYFKRSGYSTSAFLTGYHSGWYGLSAMYRGYCDNFYESTSAYHSATDDDLVTLKKIESTPFQPGSFIFIHLLSTHPVGKKAKNFQVYQPDKISLTSDIKEPLINNYDNGILQGDYVINRIFQKLRSEKLLDKTTLFVIADHGDLIFEDGQYGHSGGIHEKLLEVPILIYDQDPAWFKDTLIASLIDIAPTFVDRFFGQSPGCWQGRSLGNNFIPPFTTKVSASTVKTNLANGTILFSNDTIRLEIFDKKGQLQKVAQKLDSLNWKTTFKRN